MTSRACVLLSITVILTKVRIHSFWARFRMNRLSVLLLTICWSQTLAAHDNNAFPDLIEQVKKSVVAIGTMRPVKRESADRPPITFSGSGFVVGDGTYVISNFHVIPERLDYDNDETLAIFSGRGQQARGIAVSVVREDKEHDLVLLKLQQGRLPAMQLGTDAFVHEGSEIALTGFPIGMVLGLHPVTHRGIISSITPLVIPAISSGNLTADQIRRLRKPFEVYQLDAVAYPGNSGSAVYEVSSGKVIAVVNSVLVKKTKEALLSSPSGITYAIPVSYVNRLLQGIN